MNSELSIHFIFSVQFSKSQSTLSKIFCRSKVDSSMTPKWGLFFFEQFVSMNPKLPLCNASRFLQTPSFVLCKPPSINDVYKRIDMARRGIAHEFIRVFFYFKNESLREPHLLYRRVRKTVRRHLLSYQSNKPIFRFYF